MERVPLYVFEPAQRPWKTTQKTRTVFDFDIVTINAAGLVQPYNLTGLTPMLSIVREEPAGSGTFIAEITDLAGTNTRDGSLATQGMGRVTASSAQMDIPAGVHLAQVALWDSGNVVVDRLPRGNAFMRVIVGKKLGV